MDPLFQSRISLFVFSVCFNWETILTKEIKDPLGCHISNKRTFISIKRDFHLSPHAAPGNIDEKCYETIHTVKLSFG